MSEEQTGYEAWSILELMGHRRLGGFVKEVQVAGAGFLRIDVPGDTVGETHSTQFYPPSSVYCLTPVSEEAARIVAKISRPQPVSHWELPAPVSRGSQDIGGAWRVCPNCGERHDPDGPCDDD